MDVHMWVTRLKFKAEFDIVNGDLWMKVNENKCPCNKKKNDGVVLFMAFMVI